VLSRRHLAIVDHHETWRMDDECWRPNPSLVSTGRISLEDGRPVDIFNDLSTSEWFRQAYS
jgi:hypothetical protein